MENIDPQVLHELNQNLRDLIQVLGVKERKTSLNADDLDKLEVSTKNLTRGFDELTEAEKAQIKALREKELAEANLRKGVGQLAASVKGFVGAALSGEESLAKYASSFKGLGDAAFSAGQAFGTFGAAMGGAIKGITVLGEHWLKQADSVLKVSDSISKFAGVGAFTTKELAELGRTANLNAENLGKLVKPLQTLGTGLTSLGGTAGDGVKEFGKLINVSDETRKKFSRMGVNTEELIQGQADYLKIQELTGLNLTKRVKDETALKAASLEYVSNLRELAAITGKDVEEHKKNQNLEARRYENQMQNIMQLNKMNKLLEEAAILEKSSNAEDRQRAELKKKEAAAIRSEMDARQDSLSFIRSEIGSDRLSQAVTEFVTKGVMTGEGGQALYAMGLEEDLKELRRAIQEGTAEERKQAGAKFSDAYYRKTGQFIGDGSSGAGSGLIYSASSGNRFVNAEERERIIARSGGQSIVDRQRLAAGQTGAAGTAGTDITKDARAQAVLLGEKFKVWVDEMLAKSNPLFSGFTSGTLAAVALAAGLGAAAAAAAKFSAQAALNKGLGGLGDLPGTGGITGGKTPPGAGTAGRGALGRMAGLGSRALGLLGPVAGVLGAGYAGFEAGSALNSTFGWSDKIVDSLRSGADKEFERQLNAPVASKPKPTAPSAPQSDNVSAAPSSATTTPHRAAPPVTAPVAATGGPGYMSEEEVKAMIKKHEGKRNAPYKDSEGYWTVGYGHLITKNPLLPAAWNRRFSDPEIDKLFDEDYIEHRRAAERIPGFGKFNTKGQGALTDLTFNMGPDWWRQGPKLTKSLSEGDAKAAADNLEGWKWFRQVGIRGPAITGLLRQGGISAAEGGIASGPRSGYPATLHGTEVITPLEPNSILEKLAKTAATDDITKSANNINLENAMREMTAMHREMMAMFEVKLDDMIAELETSNSTQDQLLKHSRT